MKYKLICVDLDGTLLNDEKQVPLLVKQSLQKAYGMGIQIALVSGRMPFGVENIERELEIPCIKACNAGTYIVLGEECINSEYLLPGVMREIYRDFARKNHIPLWIFQERKWFVTGVDRYVEREIEIIGYEPSVVKVENLADQWEREKTGPNKILFAADPEKIRQIHEEISQMDLPEIDIACSSDNFLEISPKGATKGKALSMICDRLNIRLENAIAFGDHELDIPMIETAGMGVAMGNAIDSLKERADFVTKTNNEAGIAHALELLLSGK